MRFFQQEYWNELPCPSPGTLPDPEIEPTSILSFALQVDSLPVSYCSSGILAFNFSHAFVWFWYRGNAGLVKWVRNSSVLFNFTLEFENDWYEILKCLVVLASEAISSCTFVFWEVFDYRFNLITSSWFFKISYSWFRLGRLYISRNLSISSRLSNLLVYNCS